MLSYFSVESKSFFICFFGRSAWRGRVSEGWYFDRLVSENNPSGNFDISIPLITFTVKKIELKAPKSLIEHGF